MKVLLINREIVSQTHPVGGKSGKNYGIAFRSDAHGGVVMEMSLADYDEAKFDLIGNAMAGQAWIPSFVESEPPDPLTLIPFRELQLMAKEAKLSAEGSRVAIVARIRAAQKGTKT